MDINKLENGRQLGITKEIFAENEKIIYSYAIQKYNGIYYVFECEFSAAEKNFFDNCKEEIHRTDSFETVISDFLPKYDISIDEIGLLKGNNIFNVRFYVQFPL